VDAVVKQVEPAMREAAVARLRDKRATGAAISADVRRVAAALLVAESTVWRWLATSDEASPNRSTYQLSEGDRDAYLDWCGNVAGLRRARLAQGESMPSLRTLQRAFVEQMTPGERAAAVDGAEGRRRHQVYLRWESPGRNARWEGDHKELPVLVTHRAGCGRASRGSRCSWTATPG
jgi:putative transposase